MWNVERIQDHIARELPLATLFNIELLTADNSSAQVRLNGDANIVRPGGTVAGPVLFALADIATYASTLVARQDGRAATATSSIAPALWRADVRRRSHRARRVSPS